MISRDIKLSPLVYSTYTTPRATGKVVAKLELPDPQDEPEHVVVSEEARRTREGDSEMVGAGSKGNDCSSFGPSRLRR